MRSLLILISASVAVFALTGEAATTSKKSRARSAAPTESLSVREEALRQLSDIPTAAPTGETPSVMMPLKAEYNPIARRAWDWILEAELYQRQLTVPRPVGALGPDNLNSLPAFTTFGLGAGLEKSLALGTHVLRFGVLGHGGIAVSNQEVTLPNGLPLNVRYQWIGYGVEPRLTWNFSARWAALFGMSFDQVSTIQNSSESELAQWTQGYNERARRLALQFHVDRNQYVSLAARQIENEFESPTVYSLVWGARW
ncbi:MAG: hypothetical protein KF767_16905 [Bdellovibrionaceae bacterium]|nr:hypothetical protein [Pseudobdellovibrionaceae bacterium]